MEHSEIILEEMEKRGITPYRMAKETGITQSLFSLWIYSCNLVLIADVLNCSVDYLLGRTDDPTLHR